MTTTTTSTITDLGYTSSGKHIYHVTVTGIGTEAAPVTVNVPCMQILATVPHVDFSGNKITIEDIGDDANDEAGTKSYIVVVA